MQINLKKAGTSGMKHIKSKLKTNVRTPKYYTLPKKIKSNKKCKQLQLKFIGWILT